MARALRAADAGYSMIDLLVALAVTGTIAAAILPVFQTTLAQVTYANALEEDQLGSRAALDRMAQDLRLAGAYWAGADGAGAAIATATPTAIAFRADVDADTVAGGTETTLASASGTTTLDVSGNASAFDVYGTPSLNDYVHVENGTVREVRQVTAVAGQTLTITPALVQSYPAGSVVRSVERVSYAFDATARTLTRQLGGATGDPLLANVTALSFAYFDATGVALPGTPSDPAAIREVQITLTTESSQGDRRTMGSRIRLRN